MNEDRKSSVYYQFGERQNQAVKSLSFIQKSSLDQNKLKLRTMHINFPNANLDRNFYIEMDSEQDQRHTTNYAS